MKIEKDSRNMLLGIVLPLIFVIGAVIYSQGFSFGNKEEPKYNFLYFIDDYGLNNRLIENEESKYAINENGKMEIYDNSIINKIRLYDVKAGSYKRVSREEIENYILETQSVSPDGFSLSYGRKTDVSLFLFPIVYDREDYNSLYLKKDKNMVKLNLNGYSYYNNYRDIFIGWIEN